MLVMHSLERFSAVRGEQHFVSALSQHGREQLARGWVIVNDEDFGHRVLVA